MADKTPKDPSKNPNDWGFMFGQVIAEIKGLKESFDKNTETVNRRMDEMHERTKEDVAKLENKTEKLEDKLNATNTKVTRNTAICSIVVSLIIAALVAALKAELL